MSKGFGLGNLFQQAQDLQARLAKVQEDAARATFEGSAGGGLVKATVNGRMEVLRIEIAPGLLADGDVEMLGDLAAAAVNQALKTAQSHMTEEMGKLTGGLKIPGLG